MIFREAKITDIPEIQIVRHTVKENTLSNPALVTDADCEDFTTQRGKGWVCDIDGQIVGFSIVDLKDHNVWALFLRPEHEGKGIGKTLHRLMMDWYFSQTKEMIWLGTAPNTRAEAFYSLQGWKKVGAVNKGEVKFEMSYEDWKKAFSHANTEHRER
ncbi:GNAT family N-acetyltransferase [Pedobacter rhizosphaerae]|uniref:Acetyltransferase (GNAT) domain-containing protein n=1 Tax=Pedobacter rhizosphaerae TaxID=390241 RepID=A0A1H9W0S2_9SPHI|nr:GNAT family N-acetyltransferase [Pedobacter rhizosphaerae]SES27428.1 Acetyltransferase (GNAT) domain-containing protein [Pedobacter rhizosphaerae]